MDAALPSARFPRYLLQGVLGQGGMGVVYSAVERESGREVALKCLTTERFVDDKARERAQALFEREYHALSQLAHPHIIRAYDYGIDEHGPYYTMERLSGESLRERSPMPWRDACSKLRDIASALALVHSRSLVHRDVTPLNIHCTSDGGTKLIDFGAMMPSGVARHVVGTPAFIAPECLNLQSLDARTDLFALGACLYYCITGCHAFPARMLGELREAWEISPPPLRQYAPDVPAALDELVLSLLSLDSNDRPRTAAEVYERLTAIAQLERGEALETARAYLTRPKLVGRERELLLLRESAQRTLRGSGGTLLFRGARGIGRSRLLEAAALEAKLVGLHVARADVASGFGNSLAVARSLASGLASEGSPQLMAASIERSAEPDAKQREYTLQEYTELLLGEARRAPYALIVDDLDAVDEASCALLVALAAQAQSYGLWIVCSCDRDAELPRGSAPALLLEYARRVDLAPLGEQESRELLASMFGDVPNLDVLSLITYQRCRGNPQLLIEAVDGLVTQGLLRYADGSWSITNAPDALERALADASDSTGRLGQLSTDARELLEAIALDRYTVLTLAHCSQLLAHADRARTHGALSQLVAAHWIELHDDRLRFVHEELREVVAGQVAPSRRHELHGQLAERCRALGLPAIYEAYHRFGAEDTVRAIAALDVYNDFVDSNPTAEVLRLPITLEVTETGAAQPDFPGAHPGMHAKFTAAVMLNATYRGLPELIARRLPDALELLGPFSGMSDYRALSELEPNERLKQAFTRAAARCAAPGVGALSVENALRRQTQLCITTAVVANYMVMPELIAAIPDLTPFHALSPALVMASRVVDALSKLVRGQTWLAWDAFAATRAELRALPVEQIEPLTRMALDRTVSGYLCALAAEHGVAAALPMIDELEREMPHAAESLRSRYYLAHGDLTAASKARQRFEVLSVRTSSQSDSRATDLTVHLGFYALCNDIIGLRRTHQALQELSRARPGWRARTRMAHAELLRCRGSYQAGLEVIEQLLDTLSPPHPDWQPSAALHLELLLALGQSAQARALGGAYMARARAAQLPDYRIALALAQASAAHADHEAAEQSFGDALAQLEQRNASGVLVGCCYEIGARLALARGDQALFQQRSERCARHFALGRHPGLTARYNALRRAGTDSVRRWNMPPEVREGTVSESLLTLAAEATDDTAFYRAVLDALLSAAAAVGGVLYAHRQGTLQRVAMAGALANRTDLDRLVAPALEVDADATAASLADEVHDTRGLAIYALDHPRDEDGREVEGVVVLDVGSGERMLVAQTSLVTLARALAVRRRARAFMHGRSYQGSSVASQGTSTNDDSASH